MQVWSMKLLTAALLTAGVAACTDVSGPSTQSAVGTYYLRGSYAPYTGSLSGGGSLLGGGADLTIAVNGTVSVYAAQS